MAVPVISIAQMREWERVTWATGQTEAEVIRRVGQLLGETALRLTHPNYLILILAGKGHNGDDARCAREHLTDRRIDLLDVRHPETDLSKLDALLSLQPDLVIDGLFGTGINRPLDAQWIRFIERINAAQVRTLAVDVPSGINGDTGEAQGAAVRAQVTLTVGAPKAGLLKPAAWEYVGRLVVAPEVGLAPMPENLSSDLLWTAGEDFLKFPPERSAASHKGDFGHLAILAGSMGYHGAAVLAARGAQKARPGLITLFPHESAYLACATQLQAVMVRPWLPRTDLVTGFSTVLIGPGLAAPIVHEDLYEPVQQLWRDAATPVVVDASALAWLPKEKIDTPAARVITPHPGEAARLLNTTSAAVQSDRPRAVRELSRQFGNCWVVLKGHQTLIGRCEGELFVNSSGSPNLAQGGSGDVLAGYIAGFLAQPTLQRDVPGCLRFAVWEHGATADRLDVTRPNWIVEDLAANLGRTMPA